MFFSLYHHTKECAPSTKPRRISSPRRSKEHLSYFWLLPPTKIRTNGCDQSKSWSLFIPTFSQSFSTSPDNSSASRHIWETNRFIQPNQNTTLRIHQILPPPKNIPLIMIMYLATPSRTSDASYHIPGDVVMEITSQRFTRDAPRSEGNHSQIGYQMKMFSVWDFVPPTRQVLQFTGIIWRLCALFMQIIIIHPSVAL